LEREPTAAEKALAGVAAVMVLFLGLVVALPILIFGLNKVQPKLGTTIVLLGMCGLILKSFIAKRPPLQNVGKRLESALLRLIVSKGR
jgi:hypothetical protein